MLEEKYLTAKQVAEAMKVCPLTIYRLIQKGDLSTIKIGRQVRILQSSLDQYLLQQKGI